MDRTAWDLRRTTNEGLPEYSESLSAALELGEGVRVFASVFQAESEWMTRVGRLDFNPARLIDPLGHGLAAVADLEGAIVEAVGAVAHYVKPGCARSEMRMTRLDVARDISVGVEDSAAIIEALVSLPRKWARGVSLHVDPRGVIVNSCG